MDDRQEFNATFEGGVFKPDQPVDFPEHAKVRLIAHNEAGTVDQRSDFLQRMRELRAAKVFRPGGMIWTREQLYERD